MSSDDFVQFMESLQTTKNLIMDPSRSVSTSTYAKITIRMFTIDRIAALVACGHSCTMHTLYLQLPRSRVLRDRWNLKLVRRILLTSSLGSPSSFAPTLRAAICSQQKEILHFEGASDQEIWQAPALNRTLMGGKGSDHPNM